MWTLVDSLPDDAVLTARVVVLREARTAPGRLAPAGATLLTTEDIATHYGVSRSTARAKFRACPSAFRLRKHGWRLPATAIAEMTTALRGAGTDTADLGAWRRVHKLP